jgi:hypothetical protein
VVPLPPRHTGHPLPPPIPDLGGFFRTTDTIGLPTRGFLLLSFDLSNTVPYCPTIPGGESHMLLRYHGCVSPLSPCFEDFLSLFSNYDHEIIPLPTHTYLSLLLDSDPCPWFSRTHRLDPRPQWSHFHPCHHPGLPSPPPNVSSSTPRSPPSHTYTSPSSSGCSPPFGRRLEDSFLRSSVCVIQFPPVEIVQLTSSEGTRHGGSDSTGSRGPLWSFSRC